MEKGRTENSSFAQYRTMSSPTTERDQPLISSSFQLDPLQDPRWAELIDRHSGASVFHTVPWLQALHHSYQYEPLALTTSAPGTELKNGVLLCRVNSWLTGRRLVSLPFSDHCEPLCDSTADLELLIRELQDVLRREQRKYFEFRPVTGNFGQIGEQTGCAPAATYFLHRLDLRPDLAYLFSKLDHDSVQRRIERADRAELVEKCGRSEELLAQFYALFVATRRRQRVPPSPYSWFRNLVDCQKDALQIRLAYKGAIPIAAILTLQFKNVVYYKYGCSDARFNRFGATPWLFWKAIIAAKSKGATQFDLGRTQEDNPGLVAFKNRWVPHPERLTYWRYPPSRALDSPGDWKLQLAKTAFSVMPSGLLTRVGALIYRHIG
jgi:hypothetical protein